MVQGLAVHVVQVRVPLRGRDTGDVVEVAQAGGREELFQGRGEGELVEVAGGDNSRVGVVGEEGGCEVLFDSVSYRLCICVPKQADMFLLVPDR